MTTDDAAGGMVPDFSAIFRNDKKQAGGKSPDYTLHFVLPDGQPPMRRAEPGQAEHPAPDVDDSAIPF